MGVLPNLRRRKFTYRPRSRTHAKEKHKELFNPAVSLALCLVGAIDWLRAILITILQIAGGICAAAVVAAIFPGPLKATTRLNNETSIVRGLCGSRRALIDGGRPYRHLLVLEMFLTAMLVLAILMLAVEKHKATFMAPFGIGLALFITQLAGVYFDEGNTPCYAITPLSD